MLAHNPVRPLGFPEFNGITLSSKYLQDKEQGLNGQCPALIRIFNQKQKQSQRPEDSSIDKLRISDIVD